MLLANRIFSHLTKDEKKKLYELSKSVSDGICLEIGSYIGASACFISAGLKNGKIICIDSWANDAMSEGKRRTLEEFINNTNKYKDKIIKIQGYSTNVVDQVKCYTDKIDLLFIDADHSYEGCKNDWESYKGFLKSGSIVVFHDYGWAEGVQKVVHEDVIPRVRQYKSLSNIWWAWVK